MAFVKRPIFIVTYNGKNITEDITKYLLQLTYTDKLHGTSDEVTIELEDTDKLWQEPWFPVKGDILNVQIGYDDFLVNCGNFSIDEIELNGPPRKIQIRGIATLISKSLRTKNSYAHEDQTLRQIAETFAQKHGLTLVDGTERTDKFTTNFDVERNNLNSIAATIRRAVAKNDNKYYNQVATPGFNLALETVKLLEQKGRTDISRYIASNVSVGRSIVLNRGISDYKAAMTFALTFAQQLETFAIQLKNNSYTKTSSDLDNIRIGRTTQNRETDLAFLEKIGRMYGFLFSVRDTNLVFIKLNDVEKRDSAAFIDVTQLLRYTFRDKSEGTFKSASVKYYDPDEKALVESTVDANTDDDSVGYFQDLKSDILEMRTAAENKQQAEAIAKSSLHNSNKHQQEADFTVEGNPLFVAGNNFELTNMGAISGVYTIQESSHKIERSGGYKTDIKSYKVNKPKAAQSATGTGGGNISFCSEKTCLTKNANLIRTAISKNDLAFYRANALPAYEDLFNCAVKLKEKGKEKEANYIFTNINFAKSIVLDRRPYTYNNAKAFLLTFAQGLDKIAGTLKC